MNAGEMAAVSLGMAIARQIFTAYSEEITLVVRLPHPNGAEPFAATPSARALRIAAVVPSETLTALLTRVHGRA